jgi:hypothetical protein
MKTLVKDENVQLLNETLREGIPGCKKIILDIHINERTTSSLLFFNSQTIFYVIRFTLQARGLSACRVPGSHTFFCRGKESRATILLSH